MTPTSERTPRIIAAEINTINHQTGRLIQLYEAYGPSPDLESNANWSSLFNLTYTNALILLDVPEELRSDFVAHNDVENMSSRELKRAVGAAGADGDGEGAPSLQKLDQALRKINELEKVLCTMITKISDLADQVRSLEERVEEAAPAKVGPASTRSSAPVLVTSDLRVPEFPKFTTSGFENADPEYYTRQAESLFEFHRSNIRNSFEQLTLLPTVLTKKDKEMKERLRKQLKSFLENMAKSINQWPPRIKMS